MDLHCPLIREFDDPSTLDPYTRDVRIYYRQMCNLRHQLEELTLEARGLAGLRMLFEQHEKIYEEKNQKTSNVTK